MPADIYSCVMYCIFYFICASGNNTDMDKSRGEGKGRGEEYNKKRRVQISLHMQPIIHAPYQHVENVKICSLHVAPLPISPSPPPLTLHCVPISPSTIFFVPPISHILHNAHLSPYVSIPMSLPNINYTYTVNYKHTQYYDIKPCFELLSKD
jgi:hypothetical protein